MAQLRDNICNRNDANYIILEFFFHKVDLNLHYGDRFQFHLKLVGMTALEGSNYKWLKNS